MIIDLKRYIGLRCFLISGAMFISDDLVSVFGCCNMVRIITNFYEVKILYQKLLRFQSCKLVIEQNVVQNCIKYCGIKKGQIPCEIFHNSNQIRFSHWIPSSSSTFTFIFYASGLSHRYLRKKRRSLAALVRIHPSTFSEYLCSSRNTLYFLVLGFKRFKWQKS